MQTNKKCIDRFSVTDYGDVYRGFYYIPRIFGPLAVPGMVLAR